MKALSKTIGTKPKSVFLKVAFCCLALVLLQASQLKAQYARVELTNPGRYISPYVIQDQCNATLKLYTDASCTAPYVAPSGGLTVYVDYAFTGTVGVWESYVQPMPVVVEEGTSSASLGVVIIHMWEYSDSYAEGTTYYNYNLYSQYTQLLNVSGDTANPSSYTFGASEYSFVYDYFAFCDRPYGDLY